jgi:CRP-like cAMP-binding protein
VLHHQGDETAGQAVAIWGILSGSLRLELMTDSDGGCAVGMLQTGAWLGVAPNFTGQPRLTSISTREPVELRVSQEEVGAAANLTSRSVRHMLRKLEEDGRVRVQYRRITLLSPHPEPEAVDERCARAQRDL